MTKLTLVYVMLGAAVILAIASYYGTGGEKPVTPPNVIAPPPK